MALGLVDVIVISSGGRFAVVEYALAGVALGVLGAGLATGRAGPAPWAVLISAAAYLLARNGHAAVDGRAVLVGTLLLATAELAYWSAEEHPRIRAEPPVVRRRLLLLAGLLASALVVDVLLLVAASLAVPRGVLFAAVGTAAAVAAVALVLRMGTHRPETVSPLRGETVSRT